MIPRYQSPALKELFSEPNKFKTWFKVEIAFLHAYFEHNAINDDGLLKRLESWQESVDWQQFALKVNDIEKETRHDVIAFLTALEYELKDDARLIHRGLTSSDIVDTAWGLLLKEAALEIEIKLKALIVSLWDKAVKHQGILILGRTHGQAAEPMTFGIKLLSHIAELTRGTQRFLLAKDSISVGKLSGAVGIYSFVPTAVEEAALKNLGLSPELIASQIVSRDRHAFFFSTLAVIAGSIERLALELRLLAHGGIREVSEPFINGQKGSSAMPHKKNPVLLENVCGLTRLIRSYAMAALEDQALWHERDISHSSVERVIIPDAISVLDFSLTRMRAVVEGLNIDRERMSENLKSVGNVVNSQALLNALVDKGLSRKSSYELVQRCAHSKKDFLESLKDEGLSQWLNDEEITQLFNSFDPKKIEPILFLRVKKEVSSICNLNDQTKQ